MNILPTICQDTPVSEAWIFQVCLLEYRVCLLPAKAVNPCASRRRLVWSGLIPLEGDSRGHTVPFHSTPSEASLTVKAIPYSAHGRRFESQLAGDFHLERGVRLSGTPPAVETVGGIYTPRVGQLQRGCPWLLVGDLFNSTLLYFTMSKLEKHM